MSLFLMLLNLLPSILSAIKGVEDAVGAGKGATKKELVMNIITAVAKGGENIPNHQIQAISTLVDSTVGTLKTSGVLGTPSVVATGTTTTTVTATSTTKA